MNMRHEEWLKKAESDLNFAKLGFRENFYEQVCFLSQQAIEKSFKGLLVFLNRPYPKRHNLGELAKMLPELELNDYEEILVIIDSYYIPSRYPDAIPGMKPSGPPSKEEAGKSLKTANEIFKLVSESVMSKNVKR